MKRFYFLIPCSFTALLSGIDKEDAAMGHQRIGKVINQAQCMGRGNDAGPYKSIYSINKA